MPPLTAEVAGVIAVVLMLLATALVVDPQLRATRKANRATRTTARKASLR